MSELNHCTAVKDVIALLDEAEELKKSMHAKHKEASVKFEELSTNCEHRFYVLPDAKTSMCKENRYFCGVIYCPLLGRHGRYIPNQI